MGRDKHEKERHRERVSPFVMVLIDTLDAPAWRAMSLGARMLYIALRRRYNFKHRNNGRIFLSQRNWALTTMKSRAGFASFGTTALS